MLKHESTSLATDVHISQPDRSIRRRDVVVRVSHRYDTTLSFVAGDVAVEVSLSGAERIALIEALGGTVA